MPETHFKMIALACYGGNLSITREPSVRCNQKKISCLVSKSNGPAAAEERLPVLPLDRPRRRRRCLRPTLPFCLYSSPRRRASAANRELASFHVFRHHK